MGTGTFWAIAALFAFGIILMEIWAINVALSDIKRRTDLLINHFKIKEE